MPPRTLRQFALAAFSAALAIVVAGCGPSAKEQQAAAAEAAAQKAELSAQRAEDAANKATVAAQAATEAAEHAAKSVKEASDEIDRVAKHLDEMQAAQVAKSKRRSRAHHAMPASTASPSPTMTSPPAASSH